MWREWFQYPLPVCASRHALVFAGMKPKLDAYAAGVAAEIAATAANATKFERDLALAIGCMDDYGCGAKGDSAACGWCITNAVGAVAALRNEGYALPK